MAAVSRRKVLAAGATAGAAALSGCLDGDGATLAEESDCFESVSYEQSEILFPISGDELAVVTHEACEAEYVVLLGSGRQLANSAVATGETEMALNVHSRPGEFELLAVSGGRKDDGDHVGGEILERVTVEVNA